MTEEQGQAESIPEETVTVNDPIPGAESTPGPDLAGRIGRFLLRLLVVLVLGAALGAGLYYGGIRLYQDAIEPLRTLDSRLADMQLQLDGQEADQQDQMTELWDRLAALEGRAAALTEQVSELDARAGILQEDLGILEVQASEIGQLRASLDDLVAQQETLNMGLQGLEDRIASEDLPAQRVERSLQLLRVMTIMTRARLSLNELNLGLAQADLAAAGEILAILVAGGSGEAEEIAPVEAELVQASDHLAAALNSVLSRPAVAGEELEIAWKLLVELTSPDLQSPSDAGAE